MNFDEIQLNRNEINTFSIDKIDEYLDIFILNEFGKPIYCFKRRKDTITLFPLCQALMNYFDDTQNDTLKYIITKSGLKITFSVKSPLIIVVINHQYFGVDSGLIVNQIYSLIISIVTNKTLKSVFNQSATYDLRRLLGNSEKMIDFLIENGLISNEIYNLSKYNNENKSLKKKKKDQIFSFLSPVIQLCPNFVRRNVSNISSSSGLSLLNMYNRPHLNRVLIPVFPMAQVTRESIINLLINSITFSSNDILYSILLKFDQSEICKDENKKNENDENVDNINEKLQCNEDGNIIESKVYLITIANIKSKVSKLNLLDVQILVNLISVFQNQLSTVESLWLPICLPRFNNNAFMHAHICQLKLSSPDNNLGLILLSTNKEDFDNCETTKKIIHEKLSKIILIATPLNEINIPLLHAFWYQSCRPQTIIWKSKYCGNKELCKYDYLIHYMLKRMIDSNLKTFWIRSDRHYIALLGWHSPTFQLYIQFNVVITKPVAMNYAENIIKWVKKEEDKIFVRDYQ